MTVAMFANEVLVLCSSRKLQACDRDICLRSNDTPMGYGVPLWSIMQAMIFSREAGFLVLAERAYIPKLLYGWSLKYIWQDGRRSPSTLYSELCKTSVKLLRLTALDSYSLSPSSTSRPPARISNLIYRIAGDWQLIARKKIMILSYQEVSANEANSAERTRLTVKSVEVFIPVQYTERILNRALPRRIDCAIKPNDRGSGGSQTGTSSCERAWVPMKFGKRELLPLGFLCINPPQRNRLWLLRTRDISIQIVNLAHSELPLK
ncbi:hypothetical protein BT96DRAFT_935577 [Gymnopus androsaceus JB14]|uniref:Uncharacterized protein n=1 Tax=Gymnopus androsaceus JB14 TaxID=1447944 RepID=A0A6A4I433_9AGAR|nr:hypothetical protein BT96DRAFT_935577 [Gymnopus androsaceus JB14]